MKNQLQLLADTDWQALIILDACRWDYFDSVVGQGMAVWSPANDTKNWLCAIEPILAKKKPTYYTANPLPGKIIDQRRGNAVPLWKPLWARITKRNIPTVHPWAVTGWMLNEALRGSIRYPIVVHYIQPHFPAIGSPPLEMGMWMSKWNEFSAASRLELRRPEVLMQGMDKDEFRRMVRKAYKGNVELVTEAAIHLAEGLPVPSVITSDHGELLGELVDVKQVPRYGHADR